MSEKKLQIGVILIIIGVLILFYPAATAIYGNYYQNLLLKEVESKSESTPVKETVELQQEKEIKEKKVFPPTIIVISKIGLTQAVSEGISKEVLQKSPGHYPTSVNPGEIGYCAIAGHRVTYSKPFNRLGELKNGDEIILKTPDDKFIYQVFSSKQIKATEKIALEESKDAKLILTTCAPKYHDSHRLIIKAVLISEKDK